MPLYLLYPVALLRASTFYTRASGYELLACTRFSALGPCGIKLPFRNHPVYRDCIHLLRFSRAPALFLPPRLSKRTMQRVRITSMPTACLTVLLLLFRVDLDLLPRMHTAHRSLHSQHRTIPLSFVPHAHFIHDLSLIHI